MFWKSLIVFSLTILLGFGCQGGDSKVILEQEKKIEELNKKIDKLSNQSADLEDTTTPNEDPLNLFSDKPPVTVQGGTYDDPLNLYDSPSDSITISEFREDCETEVKNTFEIVDGLTKDLTSQQAIGIAQRAGILDKNNYVKDKEVLIKDCVKKKKRVME